VDELNVQCWVDSFSVAIGGRKFVRVVEVARGPTPNFPVNLHPEKN